MTAFRLAPLTRLAIGARAFGLVILATPVVMAADQVGALALVSLGVVWLLASSAELSRGLNPQVPLIGEAALVGTVVSLALDSALALLGALAVPPFTAALRRGPQGMLRALSVELVVCVALTTALHGPLDAKTSTDAVSWVVVGIGLGLIGSFLHRTVAEPADPLTPYRDAQALIRQLIDLSGKLGSGLDPVALATSVAETVRDELPVEALVVSVPHEGGLRTLVTEPGTAPESLDDLAGLAEVAHRAVEPVQTSNSVAFPLMTDAGLVAVVAARVPTSVAPGPAGLVTLVAGFADRLEPAAVHLDTGLLFAAFRDAAASDERRRVAREMHDGLAQDIASLGYLIDAVAARPADDQQARMLRLLRERLSAVVSEVRRSVQTLRSDIGSSESLGAAVSSLARHLSQDSGIPIHVTAEEGTTRLLHDVEGELLRIAQEAMTNAVRHSGATRIDVTCRVLAPEAEIVVRDDGRGLGPRREDSQGIEIMHERARLAGAALTIDDVIPHGTVVRVATPGLTTTDDSPHRKVTA